MIIRTQTLLFTDKPPNSSAQRGASEGLKPGVSRPLQELAGPGAAKGPGCWRGQALVYSGSFSTCATIWKWLWLSFAQLHPKLFCATYILLLEKCGNHNAMC